MHRRGSVALLAALALAACAAPQAPTASPTRAPQLAAPAEPLQPSTPSSGGAPSPTPSTASSPAGTPSAAAPQAVGSPSPGPSRPALTPTADAASSISPSPFRAVGVADDDAGDHGVEGPAYADLRRVTLADDGDRLRVRVEVGAPFPTPLADGEVVGLGVDLLRDDRGESVYQLFADGGADGWFAYLQTPDGFVPYPGAFGVGGAVVEFVIPWNAIGSPLDGPFRGFVDWSRERLLRNAATGDGAPDSGEARFDRG